MYIPTSVRAIIRDACNCQQTNIRIEIVGGDDAPLIYGDGYHYVTSGGSRIYHPLAYARKGWSNMKYVGSSRHIRVGFDWLENALQHNEEGLGWLMAEYAKEV